LPKWSALQARRRIAIADLVTPPEEGPPTTHGKFVIHHVSVLTEQEVHRLLTDVALDLHWAGYLFDLTLEQLFQASFPMPATRSWRYV
jgi:hypothetical protein